MARIEATRDRPGARDANALLALPDRTVLVHDYLNQFGGAERVLEVMHDLAPLAPVYTSIYDPAAMPASYQDWDIRPSWIDRLPGARAGHQRYLPAYPLAFERLKLPDCRLVLSSSSAFAKMVAPPPGAVHVCYTHSPMRFAWTLDQYIARERLPRAAGLALRPYMAFLRRQDRATLPRVHQFIANSSVVRDRIGTWWGRDAVVIHPPVDVERFTPVGADEIGEYFLMVSRLVPYKRFDLVIEACNALKLPLWIVGDGRDRPALEHIAGPTVRFLGRVGDDELRDLYAHARAALFMSEDDFGIAQVEAQAAGRPVIALKAGGAHDTVIDGVTGVHVRDQTVESLIAAFGTFERTSYAPDRLVEHARQFSRQRFERELLEVVGATLERHAAGEAAAWS
ncbi:MAG TPA: glycosyltransferase [Thermomicrobiales bacterium]|nr:glycosyltransferase [Thermomicrobiales bacterium]